MKAILQDQPLGIKLAVSFIGFFMIEYALDTFLFNGVLGIKMMVLMAVLFTGFIWLMNRPRK